MTHQIATELHNEGHRPVLIGLSGEDADTHDKSAPYRVVRVADDRAEIQAKLDQLADEIQPDIIIVNVLGSHLPECRKVARRRNIPMTVFVYGTDVMKFANPLAFLKVWISLHWSKGIFSCSDFTRHQLPRIGVFKRHSYTMYTGIPSTYGDHGDSSQAAPWSVPEDTKVIVSLCRLQKRKGIDHAVDAVLELLKTRSNILYIVAGNGTENNALLKRVSDAGNPSQIWFIGNVTEEQKQWLYRRMDVYLMPNRRLPDGDVEGFGTTFLEANMYNKPVIGGRSGGTTEAIDHGRTGFLVSGTDLDETVGYLTKLLDHPDEALRMGEAGRHRALEQFAYDRLVPQFVKQLEAVIR
jgi:phosphatidylinositol alpha-1,6-mannosyltransferase